MMFKHFIPDVYCRDIYELDAAALRSRGIRALICDIDNTLVPYEEAEPTPAVLRWLKELEQAGIRVSFVSNNDADRVERFNAPLGFFATSKSGKPFGRCLRAAMAAMESTPADTAMLGDQIFTDVLAGRLAGMRCLLVEPIRDKTTLFFRFKRWLERPFLAIYRRRHPESPDETLRRI